MKKQLFIVLFIGILVMSLGLSRHSKERDIPMNVALFMRSVVALYQKGRDGCIATGFYIGDGRIVTAGHVVADIDIAYVEFEDGTKCEVLRESKPMDFDVGFAFIEPVDKPELVFDTDKVVRGQPILYCGNPSGNAFVATSGIVSGFVGVGGYFGDIELILVDAVAHRGNSGSPLIDAEGEVVGLYVGSYRLAFCGDFPVGCSVNVQVSDILTALERAELEK